MNLESAHNKILKRHTLLKRAPGFGALARGLKHFGNPHLRLKFVHVAGTNGKGTVCAMTARCLRAAGFKTGLFTSPHLICPTERIEINGRAIPANALAELMERVSAAASKLNYFEILTVCALIYFAEKKCDYVVLETGLGGLHDATNFIAPEVCAVTSVGIDHKDVLGATLKEIAAQKAGIIKKGVPCVLGAMPRAALKVMQKKRAPLFYADTNAGVAAAACKLLGVKEKHIKEGIAKTKMKGRFEVKRKRGKAYIFDGAHNVDAVKNFIKLYRKSAFKENAALVFSVMKNKEYRKVLNLLKPEFKNIIYWDSGSPSAVTPRELSKIKPAPSAKNLRELRALTKNRKNIFFAGSFYQYTVFKSM